MKNAPKLLLDTKQWPLPVFLLVILALGGFTFFIDASALLASTLLLAFFAAGWVEEIWKRQAYFTFTRDDDPHTFWFMLALIVTVFQLVPAFFLLAYALREFS